MRIWSLLKRLVGQLDDNTEWLRRQERRLDQMESDVRVMKAEAQRHAEFERRCERGAQ